MSGIEIDSRVSIMSYKEVSCLHARGEATACYNIDFQENGKITIVYRLLSEMCYEVEVIMSYKEVSCLHARGEATACYNIDFQENGKITIVYRLLSEMCYEVEVGDENQRKGVSFNEMHGCIQQSQI